MLPPFIIDQIRRREEEERSRRTEQRPRLELPVDAFPPRPAQPDSELPPEVEEEEPERGVIIVDLG